MKLIKVAKKISPAIHQRNPCTTNLVTGKTGAAVFILELSKDSSLKASSLS
jgi:hypothetical protein